MEPWADERSDWAADEIVAATWATAGEKPRGPGEYMRFLKKPKPKPQSEASLKATFAAICAKREKEQTRG